MTKHDKERLKKELKTTLAYLPALMILIWTYAELGSEILYRLYK